MWLTGEFVHGEVYHNAFTGKNVKRKEQAVGKKADCFYKRNLARLDHSIEGWLWGKWFVRDSKS